MALLVDKPNMALGINTDSLRVPVVQEKDFPYGKTAMFAACMDGCNHCVGLLLEHKAAPDGIPVGTSILFGALEVQDGAPRPLHIACVRATSRAYVSAQRESVGDFRHPCAGLGFRHPYANAAGYRHCRTYRTS